MKTLQCFDLVLYNDFSCRFGGRGRGRGGFPGRGRGGPRGGFGGRGKREFDRHSGSDKTGIKPIEKKDGFGSHNWGDQIEAQLNAVEESPADTTVREEVTPTTEDTPEVQ